MPPKEHSCHGLHRRSMPGVFGLWMLLWPRSLFMGSKEPPDEAKVRKLRGSGAVLVVVAVCYLAVKLLTQT